LGDLERLALGRPGHQARADRRGGDAQALHLPVDDDLDLLEVRPELPLGNAGDLLADAAQVLGLPAVGLLLPDYRLLAGDRTLLAHARASRGGPGVGRPTRSQNAHYSGRGHGDKGGMLASSSPR